MGVVKGIAGWRDSRWPIPNTLQVLVGLIEPRDPEAYLERKRALRETLRERAAIQEETPVVRKTRPGTTPVSRIGPAAIGCPSMDDLRELVGGEASAGAAPSAASEGWYRIGPCFYRIGEGPCRDWCPSESSPIPGMRQRLLF